MWRNVTRRHAAAVAKEKTVPKTQRVVKTTIHFNVAAKNQLHTATLDDLSKVLELNKHHNDRVYNSYQKNKPIIEFYSSTNRRKLILEQQQLIEVIERSNLERAVLFNSSQDRLASLKLLEKRVYQPLLAQIAWSNAAYDRQTGETQFYEAAIKHLHNMWIKPNTKQVLLFALNYVRQWQRTTGDSVLEHVKEEQINKFIKHPDARFRHNAMRILLNSCLDNGHLDEAIAIAAQIIPTKEKLKQGGEAEKSLFAILDYIKFNNDKVALSPFALGFLQQENIAAASELHVEYEHPWLSDLLDAKLDEFEKLIGMFAIDQKRALVIVDLLVKQEAWSKLDCFISAGHILNTNTSGAEWKFNLDQPQLASNLTTAAPHLGDSINTLLSYATRQKKPMARLASRLEPHASKTPQIMASALCGAEANVERMASVLELDEKEATALVRVLPGCKPFFDKMSSDAMLSRSSEQINFASLYATVNQQLVNQQQIELNPLDVYHLQTVSESHEGAWSLERIMECTAEYNSLDNIVARQPLKASPLKLTRRLVNDDGVWSSTNEDFKLIASEFVQNTIADMDGIRNIPVMWILTTNLECLTAHENGANLWPRLDNAAKASLANNRDFLARLNKLNEEVKNEIKNELNVMHPIDCILKTLMKSTKLDEKSVAEIMDHFNKESVELQIPAQNTSRALNLLKEIQFTNGALQNEVIDLLARRLRLLINSQFRQAENCSHAMFTKIPNNISAVLSSEWPELETKVFDDFTPNNIPRHFKRSLHKRQDKKFDVELPKLGDISRTINHSSTMLELRLKALADLACFYPNHYEAYCQAHGKNQVVLNELLSQMARNQSVWKLAPAALKPSQRTQLLGTIRSSHPDFMLACEHIFPAMEPIDQLEHIFPVIAHGSFSMLDDLKQLYGDNIIESPNVGNWALAADDVSEYKKRVRLMLDFGFRMPRRKINFDQPLNEKFFINEHDHDDQVKLYLAAFQLEQEAHLSEFWETNHLVPRRIVPLVTQFIEKNQNISQVRLNELLFQLSFRIETGKSTDLSSIDTLIKEYAASYLAQLNSTTASAEALLEFLVFAHAKNVRLDKESMDVFRLSLIKNHLAHPDIDPNYSDMAMSIVHGNYLDAVHIVLPEHNPNDNELSTRVAKLTDQIVVNVIDSEDVGQIAAVLKRLRESLPLYTLSWGATIQCGNFFQRNTRWDDLHSLLERTTLPLGEGRHRDELVRLYRSLYDLDQRDSTLTMIKEKFKAADIEFK